MLHEAYVPRSSNDVEGFAWGTAAAWLESILREGRGLHEWAASQEGAHQLPGRGPVYTIPAPVSGPDDCARWAVRRYRRGGALASLLGDRYLRTGESRPLRELRASLEARRRGVRTPAVIAAAVYPAWPFYRADLVTELVPNARSLARATFGREALADASEPLRQAGRLVRSLEDTRVLHADLNAGNVVFGEAGEEVTAHVIDLDRCRVLPRGARRPHGSMRRRLERSLRKLGKLHSRPLSEAEWMALRTGFDESA